MTPRPPDAPPDWLERLLEEMLQIEMAEDLEGVTVNDKPDIVTWQKAREQGPSPDLILKLCEVYGEEEVLSRARDLGWPPIALISDLRTGRRVAAVGRTPVEAQWKARALWEGRSPEPERSDSDKA